MRRALLFALAIVLSIVVEYGLVHALPWPWSLAPLTASLALYTLFQLRPLTGLAWMLALGVAADVHAPVALSETLIAVLVALAAVFVITRYISHASWYAASLTMAAVILLWDALRWLFAFLSGTPLITTPWSVVWEVVLGVALVTLWFIVLPRLAARWRRRRFV